MPAWLVYIIVVSFELCVAFSRTSDGWRAATWYRIYDGLGRAFFWCVMITAAQVLVNQTK